MTSLTSCCHHAAIMLTSCWRHSAIMLTSCWHHADIMLTWCAVVCQLAMRESCRYIEEKLGTKVWYQSTPTTVSTFSNFEKSLERHTAYETTCGTQSNQRVGTIIDNQKNNNTINNHDNRSVMIISIKQTMMMKMMVPEIKIQMILQKFTKPIQSITITIIKNNNIIIVNNNNHHCNMSNNNINNNNIN